MLQRFSRDHLPLLLILAALLLGGSSAGGVWANFLLQVLSLGSVAIALLAKTPGSLSRGLKWLALGIPALLVLQLVPLPPALWSALPGRQEIAAGFDLAGFARPWLPLSLDRDGTLSALVSVVPPLAMLLVAAQASARGRSLALWGVLALALASALLGLLQLLPGLGYRLQPYELTNLGKATGLFANRNHHATLLLMGLPCAAILLSRPAALTLAGLALSGGVLLTGSDAGALMLLPVLAASALYVRPVWRPGRTGKLALGLAALAMVALGGWQLGRRTQEPLPGGAEQHRPVIIATTLKAAKDYFPIGSGAGTFQRIYPRYEDPAGITPEYRNHAHSDYAELALEHGLPGLVLMLGALVWWLSAVLRPLGGPARAGAVMLAVVLIHSLVDYPLRTAAIAALAALAALLLDRQDADGASEADAAPSPQPEALRVTL